MNEVIDMTTDVVVVGSGAGGSGAAIAAVRSGVEVVMLEKRSVWGGSAAMSAGGFNTFQEKETFADRCPLGVRELQHKFFDDFQKAPELIRSLGIDVKDPLPINRGASVSYLVDIVALLKRARRMVSESGGHAVLETSVVGLLTRGDRVSGVEVRSADGQVSRLHARAVVLATGGFQGDRELLSRYMGPNADRLVLRSNPGSVGDGLRLARNVGAGLTRGLGSFYGHLIPSPVGAFEPARYTDLSQYYSTDTLLVGLDGRRLADESRCDPHLAEAVLAAPGGRGILIFDDHVRNTHVVAEPFPGFSLGSPDKLASLIEAGGRHAVAESIPGLIDQLCEWGADASRLRQEIENYVAAVSSGRRELDGVPIAEDARAPQTGPFYAVEVQPAITFPYGGIRISLQGEVLNRDGSAISGLYAAGSDIGGISHGDYADGIAPAFVTGTWAGEAAARNAKRQALTD